MIYDQIIVLQNVNGDFNLLKQVDELINLIVWLKRVFNCRESKVPLKALNAFETNLIGFRGQSFVIMLSSRRFRYFIICHNLCIVLFLAWYSILHFTGANTKTFGIKFSWCTRTKKRHRCFSQRIYMTVVMWAANQWFEYCKYFLVYQPIPKLPIRNSHIAHMSVVWAHVYLWLCIFVCSDVSCKSQ